jgi:hypothetical protein
MKCEQTNCDKEATKKYYWPSRPPMIACDEHAKKAFNILSIMGAYLHVEDLKDEDDRP